MDLVASDSGFGVGVPLQAMITNNGNRMAPEISQVLRDFSEGVFDRFISLRVDGCGL